jgi:hypothetical protein
MPRRVKPRAVGCTPCQGRGWFMPYRPDAFPHECSVCCGAGTVTLARIARQVHMDPRTVMRVWEQRGTPESAQNLLRKLPDGWLRAVGE